MEYSDDDFFPEERTDARNALLDLFPEEADELKKRRAEDVWEHFQPKIEEAIALASASLHDDIESMHELLESHLEDHDSDSLRERLSSIETGLKRIDAIHLSLRTLEGKVSDHKDSAYKEIETASRKISEIAYRALSRINELNDQFPSLALEVNRAHSRLDNVPDAYDDREVWNELKELRRMMLKTGRGGNMNRNIWINGNSSVLSRYGDINLKSGTNVTITYVNNDTQKTTDVTINSSASGGGTGYQAAAGTVDGTNNIFSFAIAPSAIVVDGVGMQKTQSDGTTNWTGTTTITLSVAPNFDIYAVA